MKQAVTFSTCSCVLTLVATDGWREQVERAPIQFQLTIQRVRVDCNACRMHPLLAHNCHDVSWLDVTNQTLRIQTFSQLGPTQLYSLHLLQATTSCVGML